MNKKGMPIGKFKANILALILFALGLVSAGNVKADTVPVQANDPVRLQAQPVLWCPPGYCLIIIGGKAICVHC